MTISYPAAVPAGGIRSVEMVLTHSTSRTESPFTFAHQVQAGRGERWEATVQLAPMERADAEEWIAFLLGQRGGEGTFFMGPEPSVSDTLGSATSAMALQAGAATRTGDKTITLRTATSAFQNQNGVLKAGDYIGRTTTSSARMYKVLEDVDMSSGTASDISITPSIRGAIAINSTLTHSASSSNSPRCEWRLATPVTGWNVGMMGFYGMQFTAVEAL